MTTGTDSLWVQLKRARKVAGITQAQLSEKAAVGQSMIASIERGERTPSLAALHRLVGALGLKLAIDKAPRVSDELAVERRMVENLRGDLQKLRALVDGTIESLTTQTARLNAARADADGSRQLRDLAVKSLELRTAELLAAQEAFEQERAEFVEYQRRLKHLLKPDTVESALSAIELAQVRMDQLRPVRAEQQPPTMAERIVAASKHLKECNEALRSEEGRGVRWDGLEEARDAAFEALEELLDEQKELGKPMDTNRGT